MTDEKEARGARALAYRYLALRPRSRAETAAYLAKKGVSGEVIEETLAALAGYGYIDDAAFARAWARRLLEHKGLSRRSVRYELKRKGVGEEDVDAAMEGLSAEDVEDEEAVAARLARRKWGLMAGLDHEKARRRLSDHLKRKGFSYDVVRKAIEVAVKKEK